MHKETSKSQKTLVSQSEIPHAIEYAAQGEVIVVKSYTFRQVAQHYADKVGRHDIQFVVKKG